MVGKTRHDELNDKQMLFVDSYVADFHTTNAAIAAGYSKASAHNSGSQLLKRPEVRKEIQNRIAHIVTPNSVLVDLKDIIARCLQKVPEVGSDGVIIGEYNFDAKGANKALELLGKHMAMFSDKHIHDVEVSVIDLIKALPDD